MPKLGEICCDFRQPCNTRDLYLASDIPLRNRIAMNTIERPDPTTDRLKEVQALLGRRDIVAAEALARALHKSEPHRADVNNALGIVLLSAKALGSALKCLEFAVNKEPQNALYLHNLGTACLDLGLIEFASGPLSKALALNPGLTKTLWQLGEYYRKSGKPDLALPYLEKACQIEPQNASYRLALGDVFEMLGRSADARACFLVLRDHPKLANSALYRLATNGEHALSSPLLAEMETKLNAGGLDPRTTNALHLGAAHIREQNGDYAAAFAHFRKANEADAVPFDLARFKAWIDQVIAVFTPDAFARRRMKGSSSGLPVFVIGMPRSGTTLTERIIARHPQAAGAGELDRMRKIGVTTGYHDDIGKFLSVLDAMPAQGVKALGDKYINLLRFFAPTANRIVDKMPHNFEMLGLIGLLLPEARIVHLRRNPVDTCLSCYQNKLSQWHGYKRDLTTLGLYYREYARLMDHWRRVLPLKFLDVEYEKLTGDFENEAKKLIAFLDLPWDEACLSFHESTEAVRTLSRHQVRNPIYRSSVGRWRHYENELQPLLSALGDLI
jgi:tetratricopeptide (TPR) repeat protein